MPFVLASPQADSTGTQVYVVPTNRLTRSLIRGITLSQPGRAVIRPDVHTLETLAWKIYAATHNPRQPVSPASRFLLFRMALESRANELEFFNPAANGTLDSLLATVTAMSEAGVAPETLDFESARSVEHSPKNHDVALAYRAFEEVLAAANRVDRGGVMRFFRDECPREDFTRAFRTALPDASAILVSGFDELADPDLSFIGMLKDVPSLSVYVELDMDPDNEELFGHVHTLSPGLQRLGFSVTQTDVPLISRPDRPAAQSPGARALARNLFRNSRRDEKLDLSAGVTLIEAENRIQEVTGICRLIKQLLSDRPDIDAGTICVAFPRPEVYTSIVRERFQTYGIPVNITDRFRPADIPLVVDLIGLLEMQAHGFRRDDVLRVLHSPFFTLGEEGQEIDRGNLVAIARRLRVTSGLDLWLSRIDREMRRARARRRQWRHSPDPLGIRSPFRHLVKARSDILHLNDLTAGVSQVQPPSSFRDAMYLLLKRLGIQEHLLDFGADDYTAERDARAYTLFLEVLNQTVNMAAVRGGRDLKRSLGYYVDMLKAALAQERFNLREPADARVLVTAIEETRGLQVSVMFLAGLEDGAIPGVPDPEPFSDRPRKEARDNHRLRHLRNLFYQAVTGWSEHLYLSYPAMDGEVDLVPSSFLGGLQAAAAIHTIQSDEQQGSAAVFSEEELFAWYGRYAPGVMNIPGISEKRQETFQRVRRGWDVERSRAVTHALGEFEGLLDGGTAVERLRLLRESAFSVSDLELYGTCPFKFLMERLLELGGPGEFSEELSPLERGFVIHDVLFEFYTRRRSQGLPPVAGLDEEGFEEALRDLRTLAARRLRRLDIPGAFWTLEKESILGPSAPGGGLLRQFLLEERNRNDRLHPGYFEVAFGQPGDRPSDSDARLSTPQPVRIGNIRLRGRIDRIDVGETYFAVIDYKTGGRVPSAAEIRSGISLQLPLYLYAAEKLFERTGEDLSPAAGLYYRLRNPVNLQLGAGSGEYRGEAFEAGASSSRVSKTEEAFRAVIHGAIARANSYAAAMGRGEFPLAPPENRERACAHCSLIPVCRVSTVRQESP